MILYPLLAMAPPAGGGQGQSPVFMFGWLGIMLAIFYFMLIRPQQRREKDRRKLIESVKSGDRVLFSGGIIGTVTNVKEKMLTVKIADKVKVEILRSAVSQVVAKGELPEADASATDPSRN